MTELPKKLVDENPSLKNVNRLFRAAQERVAREGGSITRKQVEDFLSPMGEKQVYYRPPQQWPGAIKKPVETDSIFDIDTLDLHTKTRNNAPEQKDASGQPYKYLAMMQDRFSRKLYAEPLVDKTPQAMEIAVKKCSLKLAL